jgi:hypothetical protein
MHIDMAEEFEESLGGLNEKSLHQTNTRNLNDSKFTIWMRVFGSNDKHRTANPTGRNNSMNDFAIWMFEVFSIWVGIFMALIVIGVWIESHRDGGKE